MTPTEASVIQPVRGPGTSDGCAHCGQPVPPPLADVSAEPRFCCAGCRAVFAAIGRLGLDSFYDLAAAEGSRERASTTDRSYVEFDDPEFQRLHVRRRTDGARVIDLYLEGVHCGACVWLVERLPRVQDGVIDTRLDLGRHVATVTVREDAVLSGVARTLDSLGYAPHPARDRDESRRREDRAHLVRLGVAFACAGNAMLLAFALYGGMLHGIDPAIQSVLRAVGLLFAFVAVAGPGRVFFRGALSSLRTRRAHMDLPVAIALSVGTAYGAWNTMRGTGEVYFESITAVVFLLLVGRWIQHRQGRNAQDAVERLYAMTPQVARRIDADGVHEVAVVGLRRGDRIEIRAGDSVPADGILCEGTSEFDLSLLTGESAPRHVAAGETLHAGCVNVASRVVMEVRSTGEETRIGRLAELIRRAAAERPPIVRLADRLAHRFVLAVLSLALVTTLVWLRLDSSRAAENAVALLIVTCPCALGLATPLAVLAALGRAASRGILVRGGEALERLSHPGLILLDKTGTVTRGRTKLVSWSGNGATERLVEAVERDVAHPIARAFVAAFSSASGSNAEASASRQLLGGGVEGEVEGHAVVVGSPAFVGARVVVVPDGAAAEVRRHARDGLTPVVVAVDGVIAGVAAFGDPLRDEAPAVIEELRARGWQVGVLSGDHPAVVDSVVHALGLDPSLCEGGAAPERKLEVVRSFRGRFDTVVMVGDGVNDAAALSAASVGVAVHGGAEASLAASDVFLCRDGLEPLARLFTGARRTVSVIRRNLIASLLYNAIAAGLAIAGVLNPLVAAVMMPISSLTVVTLSFRSRTFQE